MLYFVHRFTNEFVNKKMNELQSKTNDGDELNSVLETLLKSKNPEYALVMATDMLIAGIDTVSTTSSSLRPGTAIYRFGILSDRERHRDRSFSPSNKSGETGETF